MGNPFLKNLLKFLHRASFVLLLFVGSIAFLAGWLVRGWFVEPRTGQVTPEAVQTGQINSVEIEEQVDQTVSYIYEVAPGDSLWKLAEQQYGDGSLYPVIAQVNSLPINARLTIGQKIIIPAKDELNFTVDSDQAGSYVVEKGDSLWQIAADQFGDGARWTALYALNQTIIGGDPDLIYPGTVLRLSRP